ncbi:MAG TPA: ATP-binding protein [Longimicrobiales bacterium]|nr:ATP-binding protein [Longimicrobiales bacterium]
MTTGVTTELSERLARATEPAEALSLVLERALAEAGLPRGLVVYSDGVRRRVLGFGVADGYIQKARRAANQEESVLSEVLEAGEAARIPAPDGEDGELQLVPFSNPDEEAWGALLLEAQAGRSAVEAALAVFQQFAPVLDKVRLFRDLQGRAERLARQRDLLTTIVNSLPDPVVLTDGSNSIILANDRADHLFSTAVGDSEGRRRAVRLNNLLFSSFLTQSVVSARQAKPRELNLVDPSDGSDLLFEVLPAPMPQASSDGAFLSILRNITDLKRAVTELEAQFQRSRIAEERVREEWERLNATLENVGDPILVTDNQSNIILMNREAERLFDAPADADAESQERRAVRANDTKFTSLISDFLLHPENRRVEKFDLEDPDRGLRFPVEVVGSKIFNARGEPSAIVSVIHDLTQVAENERLANELRILNEELEDRISTATLELEERNRRLEWQSRELEKASRLKSEFLASMSHELRTPINAVLGYTSLMREEIYGELTEKQKNGLDKINSASQHLLDLINDILDLSKIEAGKMPVYLEEVSLRHVLAELSEAVEPLVREKSLRYELDVEEDLPKLFTDRTKLKQILLNLLSNAIKFTSSGAVRLAAGLRGEDGVWITVTDSGIGIKKEDLEKIFDDFRQVDQSPTREYGGTGLGLSITRKLIALLAGTIEVESDYGKGSCFTIELPLRLNPGTREEQVQRALSPPEISRRDARTRRAE